MITLLESSTNPVGSWGMIIVLVAVVAIFYFVGIRPQKKQEKQTQELRNSLQVGDEVTTIGGIIGKVVSIKDETFLLETGHDRTKLRFLKSAIRSVDVKAQDSVDVNLQAIAGDSANTKKK